MLRSLLDIEVLMCGYRDLQAPHRVA